MLSGAGRGHLPLARSGCGGEWNPDAAPEDIYQEERGPPLGWHPWGQPGGSQQRQRDPGLWEAQGERGRVHPGGGDAEKMPQTRRWVLCGFEARVASAIQGGSHVKVKSLQPHHSFIHSFNKCGLSSYSVSGCLGCWEYEDYFYVSTCLGPRVPRHLVKYYSGCICEGVSG